MQEILDPTCTIKLRLEIKEGDRVVKVEEIEVPPSVIEEKELHDVA